MTPLEATDIERLRELLAKATPGPWYHRQAGLFIRGHEADWAADTPNGEQHSKIVIQKHSFHRGSDDYALVCALKTAAPGLLETATRVKVLETALDLAARELEAQANDPDQDMAIRAARRARTALTASEDDRGSKGEGRG